MVTLASKIAAKLTDSVTNVLPMATVLTSSQPAISPNLDEA